MSAKQPVRTSMQRNLNAENKMKIFKLKETSYIYFYGKDLYLYETEDPEFPK